MMKAAMMTMNTTMRLLFLFAATASVFGSKPANCTVFCKCYYGKGNLKVLCLDGSWNAIPGVPEGATSLRVENGNFGVLQGPSSCHNYHELRTMSLVSCNITAISGDAFKCMPRLHTLTLNKNRLKNINPMSVRYFDNLVSLHLQKNEVSVLVVRTICSMRNIRTVDLSGNHMKITPGTLDCLVHLRHLRHITLSKNNISGSVKDTLEPLKHFGTIIMKSCEIKTLEEDTFLNFKTDTIDLGNNHIKEIYPFTFANLTNLTNLRVGGNPLQGNVDWINHLKKVSYLDISHINLKAVPSLPEGIQSAYLDFNNIRHLTRDSIHDLPDLEILSLSRNGMFKVDHKSLYNLPKLRLLDLSKNSLRGGMLSNLFWGIANSSLQKLVLHTNPVQVLNKTVFEFFTPNELRILDLKRCEIEKIGSATFDVLEKLEKLILSQNSLYKLKVNTFQGLHNLNHLALDHNKLSHFQGELNGIQGSPLKSLLLAFNVIKKFDSHILLGLETLTKLDLRYNDISKIKKPKLNQLSLTILDLENNRVQYIQKGTFSHISNVTVLKLSNNRASLRNLGERSLQSLVNLVALDLSDNSIGNDPPEAVMVLWQKAIKLESLWLQNCRLSDIVPGMFSALKLLQRLDLSINNIPFIEPAAFENTSELQDLYIHRNRITFINWKSFIHLPNLRTVSLAGNPLLCTCDSLWVIQAIESQRLYIPQQNAVQCKPPGEHKYRPLDLKVTDCEESWLLTWKPSLVGFTGVLAVSFLYILMYYRWHVRFALFSAIARRQGKKEMLDGIIYKYDAYVAYSREDLPWVRENLLPNVDTSYLGPEGFKLCLHDRDWLAGVDIAENMRKSIVESRRTIIVLSRTFASGYWCKLELAIAHMELDVEGHRKDRLVVILVDDIPAHLLTARLRLILTTKTYIPWPQGPHQQHLFWKAIRRMLKREI